MVSISYQEYQVTEEGIMLTEKQKEEIKELVTRKELSASTKLYICLLRY
jgi:hypothetical protein